MTFNQLHVNLEPSRWMALCGINKFELQLAAQEALENNRYFGCSGRAINNVANGIYMSISEIKEVLYAVDYGLALEKSKSVYW